MSIAVIGAGWAGLSAALTLKAAGCEVTVYESSHQPGGRARAVQTPNLSQATDNGQHILLGAYTDTLKLMQSCDVDISASLHRAPLCLTTPNNKFHFRLSHRLRGKAGMLAGLLGAQGLSWRSKYYLARALYRLEHSGWQIQSDTATLSQWLQSQRQTHAACKYFWYPLCLAALNTHPDEAHAQIMANVLRDSLGSRRSDATDILIANNLLETLWPTQACNHLALQLSTPIRRIRYTENTFFLNDCYAHSALILAVPPYTARKLLAAAPQSLSGNTLLEQLAQFKYRRIATLWIELAHPWTSLPPQPMLMLEEVPERQAYGQWLFNHAFVRGSRNPNLLAVVISNANTLEPLPREHIVDCLLKQLARETSCVAPMPPVRGHALIIEKRATFAATPGLARPAAQTPWRGILLAGDWTNTGYPAVLEGAVRSGVTAANALLAEDSWRPS